VKSIKPDSISIYSAAKQ